MLTFLMIATAGLLSAGTSLEPGSEAQASGRTVRFDVSFPSSVRSEAADGRVIVVLSLTEEFDYEGVADGSPAFGIDVEGLQPDEVVSLDGAALGDLVPSTNDIPVGDYFVISYLHVYTTFSRSDGHTVKLPMDRGEGQKWFLSPGNLKSRVERVSVKPSGAQVFDLALTEEIPPIEPPRDTEWVKNLTIQSERVSEFWGTPMHISARVLLPAGYEDAPDAQYPVVIEHEHFSTENPGGFVAPTDSEPGNEFYEAWTSADFPRFLLVTIQHPTPYYDDSYGVNSANMGPYGDAINYELLPAIEAQFRAIGKPRARAVTGCSTGGWIALATQLFYPDLYKAAWVFAPDQVDFHYYELVNLYEPENNAYYRSYPWSRLELPAHRDLDGRPVFTNRQENIKEEVVGSRYRSGGQWAAWNALFGPVADDGYPEPLWDPMTGEINASVAEWMIERFDLTNHLRQFWPTLGPKLIGKLHFYTGHKDNWYIEQAIYGLEAFFQETESPHYMPDFHYGTRAGHCWNPWEEKGEAGGLYRAIGNSLLETPLKSTEASPVVLTGDSSLKSE
jgi:hypothetical protein